MFAISTIRTSLALTLAALLGLPGATVAASAEPMAQSAFLPRPSTLAELPAGPDAVGRWLHDEQGRVIGSVRGFADGGRTAILMIGSYIEFGSHFATVPASDLYIAAGQVRLRTKTSEGMNVLAQR